MSATLPEILLAVSRGELAPDEAERRIHDLHFADMEHTVLDLHREARRGRPEAVYCASKTVEQVVEIAGRLAAANQSALLTRVTREQRAALLVAFPHIIDHEMARVMHLAKSEVPRKTGIVGVVSAGTSDMPVAEEAAAIADALGSPVERIYDVGVAGLHRLLRRADDLRRARVLIVVAGMEGALPSVVAGLVRAPVIAVPTSVGYGASLEGVTALLAMITSCSPGISTVNIDNGFGAGYLADAINEIGESRT